jgi:hypothetical protein
MHELAMRLWIIWPKAGMIEPVLGLTILTVAGLGTGIALLPLRRVV